MWDCAQTKDLSLSFQLQVFIKLLFNEVVKIQTNPDSAFVFTRVGRFSISIENRPANQEASFHEQTNQQHSRSQTVFSKVKPYIQNINV